MCGFADFLLRLGNLSAQSIDRIIQATELIEEFRVTTSDASDSLLSRPRNR